MKISELNDYLTGYLISDDIKSLLINGKWGIGKTYTITQFLKKIELNKNIKVHYCSLFGCPDINALHQQLYAKFHPHKVRGLKALSYVPLALNLSATLGFGTGIDTAKIAEDLTANQVNKPIKIKAKTCLVIFDDLERIANNSSIKMEELLGYFNRLRSENIKIIVLCNEEEIEKSNLIVFNKFREKVFDRSINIEEYNNTVIQEFFGDNYKHLKNETLVLIDNNLRTAYKISIFFNEASKYLQGNNIKVDAGDLIFICANIISEFFTKSISQKYESKLKENEKSDEFFTKYQAKKELENQHSDEFRVNAIYRNITQHAITVDPKVINSLYRLFVYLDKSSVNKAKMQVNRFNEDKTFFLSDENKVKYIESKLKLLNDQNSQIQDYEIVKEAESWLRYCPDYFTNDVLNNLINQIMILSETKINKNIIDAFLKHEHIIDKENDLLKNFYILLKEKSKLKNEKWCIDYFNFTIDNLANYSSQLSNLSHFLKQNELELPNELINIIVENNFYIPDLSQNLNGNLWDFCHSMCHFVVNEMPNQKEQLKNYLLSLKNNNTSKCLSERVDSLIKYSIDKNQDT